MSTAIANTTEISREEWLELRKKGLGGSDAPVAAGLSPYKSPDELFYEKTGALEPDDLSDNEYVHFGNVLEDVVADEFERRTGMKAWRHNQMIRHPEHEWMLGNIDRRIVGTGSDEGLEIKTADKMAFANAEWGEDGTDEVPAYYLIQCAHYLAVTGWERWHLAVLAGGNEFHRYVIPRDEDLIETLIEIESDFWKHVQSDTLPEIDYSHPSAVELMKKRYPGTNGKEIDLPERAAVLKDRYKRLGAVKKRAKELQSRVKAELMDMMGENARGHLPDGRSISQSVIPESEVSYTRESYKRIYI